MSTSRPQIHRNRRTRTRREGAVMLIAMLVLLMATATATFAVHATSYEIRAAGYTRRATQAQYVGESGLVAMTAWVDYHTPSILKASLDQRYQQRQGYGSNDPVLDLRPFQEPYLADEDNSGKEDKVGRRFKHTPAVSDFGHLGGRPPIGAEAVGGPRQAYEPLVAVDVYDTRRYTAKVAGYRQDGKGRMKFMRATFTGRGRIRVKNGDFNTSISGDRPYHESASDARAFVLLGPY